MFYMDISFLIPSAEKMAFRARRIRQRLCRPFPIALLFCLVVISGVPLIARNVQASEAILRDHLLMPEDIAAPGPICGGNDDLATPPCSPAPEKAAEERIPRIIHQTYKTAQVPEKWLVAYNSCKEIHQAGNWTHMLWTDDAATAFIAAKYPWFLAAYSAYPYAIQRADAIRYFLLHHYGGIYLDLDVGCRRDLAPLLQYNALFPKTAPWGVSNDVMASAQAHPLFQHLISRLVPSNHFFGTKYPTVMFSTGPVFVTRQLVAFLRRHRASPDSATTTTTPIRILHPTLYSASEHSFFAHYRGSTWHGDDVKVTVFVWHHKASITAVLSVLLLSVYLLSSPRRYGRWLGVLEHSTAALSARTTDTTTVT